MLGILICMCVKKGNFILLGIIHTCVLVMALIRLHIIYIVDLLLMLRNFLMRLQHIVKIINDVLAFLIGMINLHRNIDHQSDKQMIEAHVQTEEIMNIRHTAMKSRLSSRRIKQNDNQQRPHYNLRSYQNW